MSTIQLRYNYLIFYMMGWQQLLRHFSWRKLTTLGSINSKQMDVHTKELHCFRDLLLELPLWNRSRNRSPLDLYCRYLNKISHFFSLFTLNSVLCICPGCHCSPFQILREIILLPFYWLVVICCQIISCNRCLPLQGIIILPLVS